MADRYRISQFDGEERPRYYMQDMETPYKLFSVESFNVSSSVELEKARELQYLIECGDIIGVRVPGYAVFIHASKNKDKPEQCQNTKQSLSGLDEMACVFLEKIIKPNSYLYYSSYVEDDALLRPTVEQISQFEYARTGPHFIALPSPERAYIDGLVFDIKLSIVHEHPEFNSRIYAKNKDGRILSARILFFDNNSVLRRKRFRKLVDRAIAGEIYAAKVKGYQILLVARRWEKSNLSPEDVLVLLNQLANYFLKEEIHGDQAFNMYLDVSDEDFYKKMRDGVIRDDTYKRPLIFGGVIIIAALLAFLFKKGWIIGPFGLIMLVAYLDDMLARR